MRIVFVKGKACEGRDYYPGDVAEVGSEPGQVSEYWAAVLLQQGAARVAPAPSAPGVVEVRDPAPKKRGR